MNWAWIVVIVLSVACCIYEAVRAEPDHARRGWIIAAGLWVVLLLGGVPQ